MYLWQLGWFEKCVGFCPVAAGHKLQISISGWMPLALATAASTRLSHLGMNKAVSSFLGG